MERHRSHTHQCEVSNPDRDGAMASAIRAEDRFEDGSDMKVETDGRKV